MRARPTSRVRLRPRRREPCGSSPIRSRLALIYGSLGAIERGIDIAESALALADHELADWRYWPLGNLVRLLSWQGNITAAAALLAEAADFSNMGHFEMRMALPLARIELALIQRNFELD